MVGELFKQAAIERPDCPVQFVQDNLTEIVASKISAFEIVEKAGQVALTGFEPRADLDMVALINDRRIFGEKRPIRLVNSVEAMK